MPCRALLEEEDVYFERHASVTSHVGRVRQYREHLDTSFPTAMRYRRERCDYDLFTPDPDAVRTWMSDAAHFIAEAEVLLFSPTRSGGRGLPTGIECREWA